MIIWWHDTVSMIDVASVTSGFAVSKDGGSEDDGIDDGIKVRNRLEISII